ncbi:MAG: hypothetical protein COW03_16820 [Cytophagales bacterium CG12_big_fil_rev_8_21_14_0_65_40_12]|nr:MAG: hypothetical protein COW03_16820 [Cytophagales bacterium CG12_big_fil_rev_8_21_14_0_65_40_12]PIW04375.1 MAG: hypothetical protein COW40_10230 [Cytophagales bacterium CG17_big_fil_post_rev_8_21_14_2_50_40_13]
MMMVSLALVAGLHLQGQDANKTLLQTELMAKELGLNAKQKAELDKELKANQQDRKEKMEKLRAMREEMKRDAFVEQQAREARLKSILTEEQFAKLEAMKAERSSGQMRGQANFGRKNFQDRGRTPMMKRKMLLEKRRQSLQENKEKGDGGN